MTSSNSGNNNDNNRSNLSTTSSPTTAWHFSIIEEVFPHDNNFETRQALAQLDRALDEKCRFILIGPKTLGEQTSRWLALGNLLHRASVTFSIGSFCTWYFWPQSKRALMAAWGCAAACATLYWFGWARDPCCNYKVETDPEQLMDLQLTDTRLNSAVILMRCEDKPRQNLQLILLIAATGMVALRRLNVL